MVQLITKIFFLICWFISLLLISNFWNDKNANRKLFAGIMGSFLLVIFDGFVIALFGIFSIFSLFILLLIETVALLGYQIKSHICSIVWVKEIKISILAIILIMIAGQLLLGFPSMNIYGGRDEGLYFMQGIHIAKTGAITYEEDQYLVDHYEDISQWCELGYLGVYSKYNFNTSDSYGAYEFQFMPLMPVALAIGYILGGISLLIRMNGIIGIMSLVCIYCFVSDFLGNKLQAFFTSVLLLFSPAFLWNARATFSETLAQFLIFLCFYIFAKGWDDEKIQYSILAGIVIIFALLTRIDTFIFGIGILVAAIIEILTDNRKTKYYVYFIMVYFMAELAVGLYSMSYSYSYIYEHKQYLFLILLVQIIFLAIFLLMLYFFKGKNYTIKNFLLRRNFQILFLGCYYLTIFFLLFIRPQIEENNFAVRAIKEFSWYTSMIAILLVPIGIVFLLNNSREKVNRNLLFLCVGGSSYLLYIINPSISEDHIWASRRWILLGIPFVIICFMNAVSFFQEKFGNEISVMLVIIVLSYLIYQDSPFISTRMFDGLQEQYAELAKNIRNDSIYYTTSTRLATTLRFVYDKNIYFIDKSHLIKSGTTEECIEELYEYLNNSHSKILFIGEKTDLGEDKFEYNLVNEKNIKCIDLEKCVAEFPRKLTQLVIPANIYEVKAK